MKILTIFLISITLWCVMTKEQNKSNISSEKVVKTEEKKTEVKITTTSKTSDKLAKSETKSADISDPNISHLFPVTTANVNVLRSLSEHEGFTNALLMPRIPLSLNNGLNTGEMVHANGSTSLPLYYDGRNNLNAIHVNCSSLNNQPQMCTSNAQCGWCGGNNSCIAGTPAGPLAPCLKDTFQYAQSSPMWNPLRAGTINNRALDSQRRSQIFLAPLPDLEKANVYAPYH